MSFKLSWTLPAQIRYFQLSRPIYQADYKINATWPTAAAAADTQNGRHNCVMKPAIFC